MPDRNSGSGPSVLIVEDNSINRRVMSGLLALHGLAAEEACDGLEALQACARKDYDLILMDSFMPNMDGYECTRALRARTGGARPFIVGVTADAMAGSRERCLESGMDDMITKPVMDRDLTRILSRWLDAPAEAPSAPAPPEASEPWVDEGQLEEMNSWIRRYNPSFRDKALRQFDDSYARLTAQIREAFREGRFQEAGEAAHALKGVCLMLGLRRMGEICKSLETAGLQGPTRGWSEKLDQLEAARSPSLEEWSRRSVP